MTNVRNRVFSMARVHDHLYSGGNISQIDMDDYLRDLVLEIVSAFQRPDLIVETKVEAPIAFAVERAIPSA